MYVHISKFAIDTAFLGIFEIPLVGCPAILTIFSSIVEKLLKKWRIEINDLKCTLFTFTILRESCPGTQI